MNPIRMFVDIFNYLKTFYQRKLFKYVINILSKTNFIIKKRNMTILYVIIGPVQIQFISITIIYLCY